MTSAADKVFSTPEMLEAILLEVDDMQTLLLSQRVSKLFKGAIESSIHLQRALWFKPTPKDAKRSYISTTRNPLISKFRDRLKLFSVVSGDGCVFGKSGSRSKDDFHVVAISIHELVLAKGSWRRMILYQPEGDPDYWLVEDLSSVGSIATAKNWYIMYDDVDIQGGDFDNSYDEYVAVSERDSPPTMGEIHDAIEISQRGSYIRP